MKILVEITGNKASFGMEVLKNLSFVKQAKPFSASASKLHDDLNVAVKEVRLHKEGNKIKNCTRAFG